MLEQGERAAGPVGLHPAAAAKLDGHADGAQLGDGSADPLRYLERFLDGRFRK